ncbi:HEAT repeat domain-containing protein [bacterium]|nr:HEAT repeat domain-containing protein [bacterium]
MRKIIEIMAVASLAFSLAAFAGDKLSTQELLDNLKHADASKRANAAEELGARGEKLGLDALIQATADKEQKVQMAAVVALGKINDPRQVEALSTAIRNSHGKAQKEAMHLLTERYIPTADRGALKELWNSVEDLFTPPHPIVVEPWIQVDQQAIDALVFVLDDKNSENRIEAAADLGILKAEPAIPHLATYLHSPNEKMVRTCVRSIGYIGKKESGEYLIPTLQHSDEKIVADAANVLGLFHYRDALPELIRLLDYSRDYELKKASLQAISRIGDPSSEPIMKKYFGSDDKDFRQYAIEGFGRMKLHGYLDPLKREFQRENSRQIKLALSFSLFMLGDTAYIDTLVRSLDDSLYSQQVRFYLFELGGQAVPKIADYLKVQDASFRIKVIRILGDMHQTGAITYLEPYMKDKNVEVAQAATDAIRELKLIENLPESSNAGAGHGSAQ